MSSDSRKRRDKRRKSNPNVETASPTTTATPYSLTFSQLSDRERSLPQQVTSTPGSSTTHAAPVAIPRLPRESAATEPSRRRVGHACEPCRQQKARCSGERPVCSRCQEMNLDCNYAAGKRAMHEQEFEKLKEQNAHMLALLYDIRSNTSADIQQRIQNSIDSMSWDSNAEWIEGSSRGEKRGGESDVTAEVGSQGSVDVLLEDVEDHPNARATGYLGKGSDIQWLRAARRRKDHTDDRRSEITEMFGGPGESGSVSSARRSRLRTDSTVREDPLSAATWHLDEQEMLTTQAIDPDEMPTPEVAHTLFNHYLENVNKYFPFIGDGMSTAQLISSILDAKSSGNTQSEKRARALLNIVFAIGASYAHLIGDAQGDERDHFLYYTRARMLGLEGGSFVDHPTIQLVQITALTGFYYICSSQISRSWMIIGYACRAVIALGLHMRNEQAAVAGLERETRVRLFWAVWLLERQIVALTGRPTSLHDSQCSIPQPTLHMSPESMAAGGVGDLADRCLNLRIALGKIGQDTLELLYSPSTVAKSWASVQVNIRKLEQDLKTWKARVPPLIDFVDLEKVLPDNLRHARMLGFQLYTVRMLMTRPCLCRLDLRMKNQTEASGEFNQARAVDCVHAAEAIVDMLPEHVDAVDLYRNGPWHHQIHILMQACAVIMLELSFKGSHCSKKEDLVQRSKKLAAWLRDMARHSAAASRAWKHCTDLLVALAPRVGADISDVATEPPLETSVGNRQHSVYPFRAQYNILQSTFTAPRVPQGGPGEAASGLDSFGVSPSQYMAGETDVPMEDPYQEQFWPERSFFSSLDPAMQPPISVPNTTGASLPAGSVPLFGPPWPPEGSVGMNDFQLSGGYLESSQEWSVSVRGRRDSDTPAFSPAEGRFRMPRR